MMAHMPLLSSALVLGSQRWAPEFQQKHFGFNSPAAAAMS